MTQKYDQNAIEVANYPMTVLETLMKNYSSTIDELYLVVIELETVGNRLEADIKESDPSPQKTIDNNTPYLEQFESFNYRFQEQINRVYNLRDKLKRLI